MPSRSSTEQLRAANAGVSALAADDLAGFWSSLDLSKPEAARDLLLEFTPVLTDKYGDLAALAAADWYDQERAAAGMAGRFTATLAPTVVSDRVQGSVRYAAGHLFTEDPTATLDYLRVKVDKFALQPGRDTIAHNASMDGVSWARVPSGSKTCAFCLAMASRGFVYRSEASADHSRFHGDCHCIPVPDFDRSGVEGYDPDALRAQYYDAQRNADGGGLSATLSSLRQQEGIS